MNKILNKTFSKIFLQKRFYLLLIFPCLFLLFFVFDGNKFDSNIKNSNVLENNPIISYNFFEINKYNLNSPPRSNEYYMSNIIGEWYLQGYSNAMISIYPVEEMFHSNELKITSTNIGLFTLEEFSNNDLMTGISNLDFDTLREIYSLDLIGGKLGTLLLKKGENMKAFNRTISPFAIEGVIPPNCACAGTCQN
jgi:hypothetical protein